MIKLTPKEISGAVGLARANSPETKKYVGALLQKAPAAEGLLLSAVLAEIKSVQFVKSDEQGALKYMARVNVYNGQVAIMLARAMKEKNMDGTKEIIGAINKFDGIAEIVPGELKFGIKYMVAEIFGNEQWMAKAAKKLKEIVDTNIGLKIAAENYAYEIVKKRLN